MPRRLARTVEDGLGGAPPPPSGGSRRRIGLIPNETPSIDEMRRYIQSEHVKWGALVKQLGLEGSQ